jgi:hypothetical protein
MRVHLPTGRGRIALRILTPYPLGDGAAGDRGASHGSTNKAYEGCEVRQRRRLGARLYDRQRASRRAHGWA